MLVVLASACGSTQAPSNPIDAGGSADGAALDAPRPDGNGSASCPSLPAAPSAQAFSWFFAKLSNPTTLSEADYAAHFAEAFRARVPIAMVREQMASLGGSNVLFGLLSPPEERTIRPVIGERDADVWALELVTDAEGRIEALEVEAVLTWSAIDAVLAALPHRSRVGLYELRQGGCELIHGFQDEARGPIGSVFKLYILAALSARVRAGEARWDDTLAIDARRQSTGPYSREPAGTRHTLVEYAENMISISDNTATDHLLFFLGRATVEAHQAVVGHGAPELNVPFLAAHDALVLKFALPDPEVEAYLALDTSGRRAALDGPLADIAFSESDVPTSSPPRYVDRIEWFASPGDACRVLSELHAHMSTPALSPLREILRADEPRVADTFDPSTWPYVGFKSGVEPGVSTSALLLERCDGRAFALLASFDDNTIREPNPEADTAVTMTIARALVAD